MSTSSTIKTVHKEKLETKGPGYEVDIEFDCPDEPSLADIAKNRVQQSFNKELKAVKNDIKGVPADELEESTAVHHPQAE